MDCMKREKTNHVESLKSALLSLQNYKNLTSFHILDKPSRAALLRKCLISAEIEIQSVTRSIQLEIGLEATYPNSLPIALLKSVGFPHNIPHIQTDGYVCYTPNENITINPIHPDWLLEDAVEKAIQVIEAGISNQNQLDFLDEFDAYWRGRKTIITLEAYISPAETVNKIVIAFKKDDKRNNRPKIVTDTITYENYWHNSLDLVCYNGIYIPLTGNIYADLLFEAQLTTENIRNFVFSNITPKNKKLLKRHLREWDSEEYVFLNIPKPTGGEILTGVMFRGVKNAHPLDEKGNASEIVPISLNRHDKTYLIPRGGANEFLHNKKVALVGCGAVGGYLSAELIQCGILKLSLIDNDVFKPENIFRHAMGKNNENLAKADALKAELERRFPYTEIQSYCLSVDEFLNKAIFEPSQYDLIILATGDDNVSLYVNSALKNFLRPPVIYTWLEPYGIGGHVVVTHNESNEGCFECLFVPVQADTNPIFWNRASFVEPGQAFSKDISGCGNRFTPFSALDANTTAILAARIAVKVLAKDIQGNLLYSWKGDETDFAKAGFVVSNRYRLSAERELSKGIEFYNPKCPICRP